MSNVFDPIQIRWNGGDLVIPPAMVLRTIAAVEQVIVIGDLIDVNRVPLAKVSIAYGIILRSAGARVTDDEVYEFLWSSGQNDVIPLITMLTTMMIPKKVRVKAEADAAKARENGESTAPPLGKDGPTGQGL